MTADVLHLNEEASEESLRHFAAIVFGSAELGERWFEQPATALTQLRPADLMTTTAGRELVRTILGRIDFCVFT